MSELTEWLTAIGTVATGIVALIVAFIPSIKSWYNKPRFSIEFKNEKPFCRITTVSLQYAVAGSGSTTKAYWIRLRIRNSGRSVAKVCEGKLVRIVNAETGEVLKDFDPVILKWVGTGRNNIDINKSEHEYLDLVCCRRNDPNQFHIPSREEEPRGINLSPPRKDYVLHVVIYGENVEPLEKAFYLKNNKEFDKSELSLFEEIEEEQNMNEKPDGTQFFLGLILAVISSAWIKSIFNIVEARLAKDSTLDFMWSSWAIFFNICLLVYMTLILTKFYKTSRWQLTLFNVALCIPIFFSIPWSLLL